MLNENIKPIPRIWRMSKQEHIFVYRDGKDIYLDTRTRHLIYQEIHSRSYLNNILFPGQGGGGAVNGRLEKPVDTQQ